MRQGKTELYRHFDIEGRLLYVGISFSAALRLFRHARASRSSRRSPWFKQIATITIQRFPTRKEALQAEVHAIQEEHPLHNVASVPQYAPRGTRHPGSRKPWHQEGYVYKKSPEERAKIAASKTGQRLSPATRALISVRTKAGLAAARARSV